LAQPLEQLAVFGLLKPLGGGTAITPPTSGTAAIASAEAPISASMVR
jgi:hypothetical protein